MGLSSVRIKKRTTDISSSSTTTTTESSSALQQQQQQQQQHAGLRIVILQISEFDEYYSNTIVVKSGLKSLTATSSSIITSSPSSSSSSSSTSSVISSDNNGGEFTCFLTSCHLCKRPLSPHKDVYMYRGDQGFCSEECRSRQIMVDEMKEMDEKTKKRLKNGGATSSPVNNCAGCETCRLLEDLRRHRRRRNTNRFKPTPALISPAKHQPLVSFS